MSNAFSELIERATAGEGLNREEIHTLLVDGEGQDFALIEAASVVRRNEFRNMIAIHTKDEALADALGTRSIAVESYEVLDISRDIDSEELAAAIERIAESSAIGVTVLLPENAVPMMLMRVLSILRLAAPAKVIHLPEGYEQSLRSLTSLAMHVVSAITITDDIEQRGAQGTTPRRHRHFRHRWTRRPCRLPALPLRPRRGPHGSPRRTRLRLRLG